jgi:hypothetical protein
MMEGARIGAKRLSLNRRLFHSVWPGIGSWLALPRGARVGGEPMGGAHG